MKTIQLRDAISLNNIITFPNLENYLYEDGWKKATSIFNAQSVGWNKIAEIAKQKNGFSILEIIATNDANYPSIIHSYLAISTYYSANASSYSISLSSSPIIRNRIDACLDKNGGIWLSCLNQWVSEFKFRPILKKGNITILDEPIFSNNKPDNTSNIVSNNGGIRGDFGSNIFIYYDK